MGFLAPARASEKQLSCLYLSDSVHLWLLQSELDDTWMWMVLERQMEQASDFWVPFAKQDRPLENNPQFFPIRKPKHSAI